MVSCVDLSGALRLERVDPPVESSDVAPTLGAQARAGEEGLEGLADALVGAPAGLEPALLDPEDQLMVLVAEPLHICEPLVVLVVDLVAQVRAPGDRGYERDAENSEGKTDLPALHGDALERHQRWKPAASCKTSRTSVTEVTVQR